ncbi:MAG: STY4851/ECs_5259 family protein [Balneola sp.]
MGIEKNTLLEWRQIFFSDRGITKPTGENLYSYKLSKTEFQSLEGSYSLWIKIETQIRSVSNLVNEPLFNQLFVLYASEWWRRKYDGGPWSWEPILDELGIDPNDWSAPKRSECVEKGFKAWGLGLKNKTGKRFLGSVAIQGGLPMNLMAENHGSVSRVLHRVVDLIPGTTIDPDLVFSWIKNLSYYLPKTYQKEEIYELLTEVIMVISSIKQEAGSDNPSKILNEWQSNSDKWKNRFPILVSDDKTYKIIENLVKKVAESKCKVTSSFITLERHLDFHGEEDDRFNIKIQFNDSVTEESLNKSFNISEDESLDNYLFLEILCGNDNQEVSLRKLIGGDKYKFSEIVFGGFSGYDATKDVKVTLRDKRGNRWNNPELNLESLEDSMPWIFKIEEEGESLVFLGQGSCKVSGNKFVSVSHHNLMIKSEEPFECIGSILGQYEINKFTSDSTFNNEEGEEFRIITKFTGDTEEIIMRGENLGSIFEMPSKAFRGVPSIFRKKESGIETLFTDYRWKMGDRKFDSSSNSFCGPVYAVKKDGDYIRWKKKAAVIPDNSSEMMIRGLNAKSGVWKLKNWQIEKLELITANVESSRRDNEQWYFEYKGESFTPETIQANIYWKGNTSPARIKLPFPTQGVRVFNKNSEEVEDGTLYSVTKTMGIRINLIPGDCKVVKLEIRSDSSSVPLKYIHFGDNETSKQLRLLDYKSDFERLLSLSQDLDEVVYFNIYFDDKKQFHIKIARYSFQLKKEEDRWYLPSEILAKVYIGHDKNHLSLKTQRLDVPGVADIEVPHRESGHLVIPEEVQSSGPWIIYTSKDSDLLMRPTYLNIGNTDTEPSTIDDLESAIRISGKYERFDAIDDVLIDMTNDPDHTSWDTIARLANEYGHLPLNSLDVWSRAIYNHDFIAILMSGKLVLPDGFIDRFALELPFMFEFIPLKSFQKAVQWQKADLGDYLFGEDLYEVIKRKVIVSDWLFESIKYSYIIALNNVVGKFDKEIIAGNSDLVSFFLFQSQDSHYQKLRQGHEHDGGRWPSDNPMFKLIAKYSLQSDPLFRLNEDYRSVVINTPILLAKWVYESNENLEKFNPDYIQMIRKVKDFDESWFTNAFNLSLLKFYYNE